jgi:hypothetical protein
VQLPLHVAWSGQTSCDPDRPKPRQHIYRIVLTEANWPTSPRTFNRDLLVSQWPVLRTFLDQQDGARRLGVRVLRTTGTGTSALRRQWLAEPQVVAAGVADGGVTDAIGLVDGLLEDLRPGGTQRLEGLV